MKKFFYFFIAFLFMFGCSQKGKKYSVTSSYKGAVYSGDSVVFTISSGKKCADSIQFVIDGKTMSFYQTDKCVIQTEGMQMGDKTITIKVFTDGKKDVYLRSMRLLSDLVPAKLKYELVASYPHDSDAYTQGLQYENGKLYETAGMYGESTLRYVDLKSGKVERKLDIDSMYFAEGMTLVGDTLYMFTWREHTGFKYDKNTFKRLDVFSYATEGWGMCFDGMYLIVSDGSEFLYFYEPGSFTLHHKIAVFTNLGAVSALNELEFVEGFVYANIYQTDKIVKINPSNGKVAAEIDMTGILPEQYRQDVDVLNGIAWNPANDHFYVTGKWWPRLFEVVFSLDTK